MLRRLLKLLPPPSRQRLVREVADALRAGGVEPSGTVYDDLNFRFRLPGGSVLFLGNLFHECHLVWPWRRRAHVRRFVRLHAQRLAAKPQDFASARPHLLPGVRDALLLDAVRLQTAIDGGEGFLAPSRPLGTRLRLCLFVDSPDSTAMVTQKDLDEWGQTFDQVLELALANLETRSAGAMGDAGPGIYAGPWHDCYDPARVLLRAPLSGLEVEGDLVAFMPNWNHLVVTGADDVAGLGAGLAFAARIVEEEPRGMSALPLVRRGGVWLDLELPRGHALEAELRKARVRELVRIYEDQTGLLRQYHEQDGQDVFAARYSGTHHQKTDDYSSYCVWSKGVVTLLPRTETIQFFDDDQAEDAKVVAHVDWDLVRLHCGALLQPTEWSQERYRVESFPTDEQLAAMRASQARRAAGRA